MALLNLSLSARTRVLIVLGAAVASAAALAFVRPIPQPQAYHLFADQRRLCGVSNFANTASNLAFLVVGIWGIAAIVAGKVRFREVRFIDTRERWPWLVFFAGVALTCAGSAYYHLAPDNDRLVWDRLPITLSFMSLFAAMITERISIKAGLALLAPLLLLGIVSVWYWRLTEQSGHGDLRLYGFVQFFPALGIPLILGLFPARYTHTWDLVPAMALYVLAKFLEAADKQVYGVLGRSISGHTLKHLAAAMATWWILRMLLHREAVPP
jgi:hypothetical protein